MQKDVSVGFIGFGEAGFEIAKGLRCEGVTRMYLYDTVRTDLLENRAAELPSPKPATRVSQKEFFMLIVQDENSRVLLEKRLGTGVWGGLWCLPEGESVKKIL